MIISFINVKGGVGKTTSCANVGAGLASRGLSVLLIDACPSSCLSRYFGIEDCGFAGGLGDWLLGRAPFEWVVRETRFKNLSIIPTGVGLASDEVAMGNDKVHAMHYLSSKLEGIKSRYDFILIDAKPSFSTLSYNCLAASDQVLIPMELSLLAVRSLSFLLDRIHEVQAMGRNLDVLGIFGTFDRRRNKECRRQLGALKSQLPLQTLGSTIRSNVTLAEAVGNHMPIRYFDRSSAGAEDYERLTEEILRKAFRTRDGSAKQRPASLVFRCR